jgi:hypothetical protein
MTNKKGLIFAISYPKNKKKMSHLSHALFFSDEATFHLSGKVNRHNVRIWALEQPHATVVHQRYSPKINVFCAISSKKVYCPFFF